MKPEQREQARLVSALVDALLLQRCPAACDQEPGVPDRRELRELGTLAEQLCDVVVEPPHGFATTLFHRLPGMSTQADADEGRRWRRRAARFSRSALDRVSFAVPGAALAVLVVGLMVIARSLIATPVASAGEILSRSDAALRTLVRPGQVLYRRWKVSTVTTDPDGATTRRDRVINEWMDGADFERVAGRWLSDDERLLTAYTSVAPNGELRPNVYFSPGVYGEKLGLLSLEPTRVEFTEAVARFPLPARSALQAYLDRQYIYLPITGERRFNLAIVDGPRRDRTGLPRLVVSLDPPGSGAGASIYRVRVVDAASIDFLWRSDGPPRVRLVRSEIVSDVVRDSYLGVRTEETEILDNGQRRVTTKVLAEMRTVRTADLSLDPFKLEVPAGTPMQRQSAFALLSGVAEALSRLPEAMRTTDMRDTKKSTGQQ